MERIARGGADGAEIDEEPEVPVVVVARAVNTGEVVLVGDAEAEAEAVGAEVYPRTDLVELALAAVPADIRAPRDGVALQRDSRVTTGNSGCLLCWPREVQSSIRVVKES